MTEVAMGVVFSHDRFIGEYRDARATALAAGKMVAAEGIVLVKGYTTPEKAQIVRTAARNHLIPSTPLRAARIGAERLLGREHTPAYLRRRPIQVMRPDWGRHFGHMTAHILNDIDFFVGMVGQAPEVQEKYGKSLPKLNVGVVNHVGPGETFASHQDSRIKRGVSAVLQTSETDWYAEEGGPRAGREPISFHADAGDLLLMTQRAKDIDLTGIDPADTSPAAEIFEDGSTIHSATNITRQHRFTIAQFYNEAA